uniref:Uncharacterized protein n=1 Tax=Anguilla anguilla TaxID=7936 RepID=A0A0E9X7E1_ANGAN
MSQADYTSFCSVTSRQALLFPLCFVHICGETSLKRPAFRTETEPVLSRDIEKCMVGSLQALIWV